MRETGRFLGERPKHLETWTDRTGQTDTQASNANAAIRSRLRTGRVAAEYYFQGIADWESGQTRQARGLGFLVCALALPTCPLAHMHPSFSLRFQDQKDIRTSSPDGRCCQIFPRGRTSTEAGDARLRLASWKWASWQDKQQFHGN
jgi:hypothetical protein